MPGVSLYAYESLEEEQALYARKFIDDITGNHERGKFSIRAEGGYDQCTFSLKGTRGYLDDWYEDGLMRRIAWYNPEAILIWEGFVNRLRYNFSDTQKTRSMDNFFNRAYCVYTPSDASTSPPTPSAQVTLIVDNLASQVKWGVKSIVVSPGEKSDDEAYDFARTIVREKGKRPKDGEGINLTRSDSPSIEVECFGYYHALKWLPYITAETGQVQAHQVIQEVLRYYHGINPWLNLNFDAMEYNPRLARRGQDAMLSCWDVILETMQMGGGGSERWVGGLYQNRRFIFKEAEDGEGLYGKELQYWRALADTKKAIYETGTNIEVKPWDLLPDRILKTVDVRT